MDENVNWRRNNGVLFGAVLIILGFAFLGIQIIGSLFGIHLGRYLWPFFVIIPGGLLFTAGLLSSHQSGEALVIMGSIITSTGVLLFFQNITGLWASWAYAWALIAPLSLGLGLLVYGVSKGLPEKVRAGRSLATIGLIIFVVGGVFFELIVGISGFGVGRFGWPLALIGLGVLWLVLGVLPRRRLS